MNEPLFDSGVLYAALDRSDRWHQRSAQLIAACRRPPLVPVTTLPEVCYFARKMLGAAVELAFIRDLADGAFAVQDLVDADLTRAVDLMAAYPEIGFVDASIVAVAERLKISTLATIDRRHFTLIRPLHVPAFTLVP
jgi:predicted nucleic acid-binding protein